MATEGRTPLTERPEFKQLADYLSDPAMVATLASQLQFLDDYVDRVARGPSPFRHTTAAEAVEAERFAMAFRKFAASLRLNSSSMASSLLRQWSRSGGEGIVAAIDRIHEETEQYLSQTDRFVQAVEAAAKSLRAQVTRGHRGDPFRERILLEVADALVYHGQKFSTAKRSRLVKACELALQALGQSAEGVPKSLRAIKRRYQVIDRTASPIDSASAELGSPTSVEKPLT